MAVSRGAQRLLVSALMGILIICTGCSPSATQRIAEGYRQELDGRPTVLVLPLGSELGQSGSSNSMPREATRKYFYSFFALALDDGAAVKVLQADAEWPGAAAHSFTHRTFALSDEQSLIFPAPGGQVTFDGSVPDFLLIVDGLAFSLKSRSMRMHGVRGPTSAELLLVGQSNYLLWDNEEQQAAAWGSVQEMTSVGTSPSSNDYLVVFRKMVDSILAHSPLPQRRS